MDDDEDWYCSGKCMHVAVFLNKLEGKRLPVAGGCNCTFEVTKYRKGDKASEGTVASALRILHSCFRPVVMEDGSDMIVNLCHSTCSEGDDGGFDYSGFRVMVLREGRHAVAVATLRVFGTEFAEIPFVATKSGHRRRGHCRRLFRVIEEILRSAKVQQLLIPSIKKLMKFWEEKFQMRKVPAKEVEKLEEYIILPDLASSVLMRKEICKKTRERDYGLGYCPETDGCIPQESGLHFPTGKKAPEKTGCHNLREESTKSPINSDMPFWFYQSSEVPHSICSKRTRGRKGGNKEGASSTTMDGPTSKQILVASLYQASGKPSSAHRPQGEQLCNDAVPAEEEEQRVSKRSMMAPHSPAPDPCQLRAGDSSREQIGNTEATTASPTGDANRETPMSASHVVDMDLELCKDTTSAEEEEQQASKRSMMAPHSPAPDPCQLHAGDSSREQMGNAEATTASPTGDANRQTPMSVSHAVDMDLELCKDAAPVEEEEQRVFKQSMMAPHSPAPDLSQLRAGVSSREQIGKTGATTVPPAGDANRQTPMSASPGFGPSGRSPDSRCCASSLCPGLVQLPDAQERVEEDSCNLKNWASGDGFFSFEALLEGGEIGRDANRGSNSKFMDGFSFQALPEGDGLGPTTNEGSTWECKPLPECPCPLEEEGTIDPVCMIGRESSTLVISQNDINSGEYLQRQSMCELDINCPQTPAYGPPSFHVHIEEVGSLVTMEEMDDEGAHVIISSFQMAGRELETIKPLIEAAGMKTDSRKVVKVTINVHCIGESGDSMTAGAGFSAASVKTLDLADNRLTAGMTTDNLSQNMDEGPDSGNKQINETGESDMPTTKGSMCALGGDEVEPEEGHLTAERKVLDDQLAESMQMGDLPTAGAKIDDLSYQEATPFAGDHEIEDLRDLPTARDSACEERVSMAGMEPQGGLGTHHVDRRDLTEVAWFGDSEGVHAGHPSEHSKKTPCNSSCDHDDEHAATESQMPDPLESEEITDCEPMQHADLCLEWSEIVQSALETWQTVPPGVRTNKQQGEADGFLLKDGRIFLDMEQMQHELEALLGCMSPEVSKVVHRKVSQVRLKAEETLKKKLAEKDDEISQVRSKAEETLKKKLAEKDDEIRLLQQQLRASQAVRRCAHPEMSSMIKPHNLHHADNCCQTKLLLIEE
ncbi:hypothetical protein CBR_g11903 [Chara braunii]|uniref:N-acetyltransferase domain-containing protein n=1 Tax=Chara braunii TaxID=69332 RepID=A0A388KQJ1_CHABU|nr:hypothetical protein CBR_g11903 [Chara braunii]|eukprot:GBG72324.1 hypothetical protein CBR_g11903 [Chara braunii]